MKTEMPPLAVYRNISDYAPAYGDFVVWSGWFVTWHGVVTQYDNNKEEISIIFSTLPFLLFTMGSDQQSKELKTLQLTKIRNSPNGVFAICQHDYKNNVTIWYI
jgi:hypothetical protein